MLSAITAVNDSYAIQSSSTPTTMDVLANDSGGIGTLSISSVGSVPYGSVSIQHSQSGGHDTLAFTPSYGFTGTESFQYTASDSYGDSGSATVTVTVSNGYGSSGGNGGYGSGYSPPQVTGLSANTGPTAGMNSITLTGSNFNQVSAVMFGSVMATSYTVNSSTSITAGVPAHSAGTVDVAVVTSMGSSTANQGDQYTFQPPVGLPTITGVSPGTTTTSGGAPITITGSNFTGATAVQFSGTPAASFTIVSPTSITAVAPMHTSGQVDVQVTTPAGTSTTNSADVLFFTTPVLPPAVTGLSSSSGSTAGGNSITVLGTNFTNVTGVDFGNVVVSSFLVNSANSITVTVPAASAGTVDVTVINSAGTSGTSSADRYTFQSPAPTITGLSTTTGPSTGGSVVTISGTNLPAATGILFGTVAATSFYLNSPGSLTAIAPAEAVGAVDITIQSAYGSSAISSADQFHFVIPTPSVTGLNVTSGSITGGTTVIISGSQLSTATAVLFGSTPAASFTINANGTISAVSPAESMGVVDVQVTNSSGSSSLSSADQFTFTNPPPVVTGLSVTTGSTSGGNPIILSGSHFTGATSVLFGAVLANTFTVSNDGSITVQAPSQSAGTVDVRVVNAAGTSAVSSADQYTFIAPAPAPIPVVTGLSITAGPTSGGIAIVVSGSHFTGASSLLFGTTPASSFTLTADGAINAIVPASAAGTVDVEVTTAAGTSAPSSLDRFTYQTSNSGGTGSNSTTSGIPQIDGLDVSGGSTAGGDTVTVYGADFSNVTGVRFGTGNAESFQILSDNSLVAVSPAQSAGVTNIVLETAAGDSVANSNSQFTFTDPAALPTVTGVSLTSNLNGAGDFVSIQGTNFNGATGVSFNGTSAVFIAQSPTTILAMIPGGVTGLVNVSVTNGAGTSAASPAAQIALGTMSLPASASSLPAVTGPEHIVTTPEGPPSISGAFFFGINPFDVESDQLADSQTAASMGNYLPDVGPPGIPPAPPIWTNDPQTEVSTFGSYGGSGGYGFSWLTTDGDVTNTNVVLPTVNSDGSVEIDIITGTTSFSLTQSGSGTTTSSSSQENINYSMNYGWTDILLAANGSGYVRTHTISDVQTYQLSTVNGASSFNTTDRHTTTDGIHEVGLSSYDSSDTETIDNYVTVTDFSTDVGTSTANGLIQASTSYSDVGRDSYQDSDVVQTPSITERDTLSGSDKWNNWNYGTATDNPDLTWIASTTYSGNTSGKDKYNDLDIETSTTVTPDALGSTTLDDSSVLSDIGRDQYQFTNSGSLSVSTVNGTTVRTDTHNNSDSGNENTTISDTGSVEWDGTEPDLSVVHSEDDFSDSVTDPSSYTDVDSGSSSTAAAGSDTLTSTSIDNVTFGTSDVVHATDTSTNEYGTPTVATLNDASSDQGTLGDTSTLGDAETIAAGGADLLDAVNFDNTANEQDSFNDQTSISVVTDGQVGVGEVLNSTENLTLADSSISPSTDVIDDPGTENIPPTGIVAESDTSTETSTSDVQMQIGDTLVSQDVQTLPDGTVITDNVNNTDSDGITDDETDQDVNTEAESFGASGLIQAPTDDDQFNDQSSATDNYTQNDNVSQTIVIPVAGGSITLGDGINITDQGTEVDGEGAVGENNTADPSIDNETDTSNLTNNDQGTSTIQDSFNLSVTDPNTGEVTQIQADDSLSDGFTESGNNDLVDGASSNALPTETDSASYDRSDNENATSSLSISVVGDPMAGVTVDDSQDTTIGDTGANSDGETFAECSLGNDQGSDQFSSSMHETTTGEGHSEWTANIDTSDAAGNSTSVHDSQYGADSETGTLQDADQGEQETADANGVQTLDTEEDTDSVSSDLKTQNNGQSTSNDAFIAIDPLTGNDTTTAYSGRDTSGFTEESVDSSTDVHTAAGFNSDGSVICSDAISGNDVVTAKATATDADEMEVGFQGVSASGAYDNWHSIYQLLDGVTETSTSVDSVSPDGTDSQSVTFSGTATMPEFGIQVWGSSVGVDSNTGVTTTQQFDDGFDGSGADTDQNVQTDVTPPSGSPEVTVVDAENGGISTDWYYLDSITQTDSHGNILSSMTPVTTGTDSQTEVNGVITDNGPLDPSSLANASGNGGVPSANFLAASNTAGANNGTSGGANARPPVTLESPTWAAVKSFWGSVATTGYYMTAGVATGETGTMLGDRAIAVTQQGTGKDFSGTASEWGTLAKNLAGEMTGANALAEAGAGADIGVDLNTTDPTLNIEQRIVRGSAGVGSAILLVTPAKATAGVVSKVAANVPGSAAAARALAPITKALNRPAPLSGWIGNKLTNAFNTLPANVQGSLSSAYNVLTSSVGDLWSGATSIPEVAPNATFPALEILNPSYTPNGTRLLQNLTNQVNQELSSNLPLALTVLSDAEVAAAASSSGLARAQYGNALERLVARQIKADPIFNDLFKHVGGPSNPDFVGNGFLNGMNFDITTPGQADLHLARPGYGSGLKVIIYMPPAGFP